jgi:hypothetical protein
VPEKSYADRPLLDKLGVKPGMRAFVRNVHDEAFLASLRERLGAVPQRALRGQFDAIFVGVESASELRVLDGLREHLVPNGMVWVIAPKGKGSPVKEHALMQAILDARLVDVKVASFSPTHTSVKAVIRVAERRRAP